MKPLTIIEEPKQVLQMSSWSSSSSNFQKPVVSFHQQTFNVPSQQNFNVPSQQNFNVPSQQSWSSSYQMPKMQIKQQQPLILNSMMKNQQQKQNGGY
ncbi:hypothetical protein SNEBB_010849 [Seison nebaliae]|nr:hypothetical protein SNEBB_010849 [Seison nebaliae]